MYVCVCVCERERELCVCVCERERERERELCVCVCTVLCNTDATNWATECYHTVLKFSGLCLNDENQSDTLQAIECRAGSLVKKKIGQSCLTSK